MPSRKHMSQHKRIYGGNVSNLDKLAEDFAESVKFGKSEDEPMRETQQLSAYSNPKYTPEDIKKKFSI